MGLFSKAISKIRGSVSSKVRVDQGMESTYTIEYKAYVGREQIGVFFVFPKEIKEHDGEKFLGIQRVKIYKQYRGKGYAVPFYNGVLENLPDGVTGLYSDPDMVINKDGITAIHKKLNTKTDDKGTVYIYK